LVHHDELAETTFTGQAFNQLSFDRRLSAFLIDTLGPSEGRRLAQINQVTAQMDVLFKKTGQLLEALEVVHTKPVRFETVAKAEDEMVRCLNECVDQKEGI
jgi:hypothetical protein